MTEDFKNLSQEPPDHLSDSAKAFWHEVSDAFSLEPAHIRLLTLACQAWDRAEQARIHLLIFGTIFIDRWQQPHARPEVKIENDSRIAFARLVRELGLEAGQEPARPPSLRR
jgi:phage terminase small subunit